MRKELSGGAFDFAIVMSNISSTSVSLSSCNHNGGCVMGSVSCGSIEGYGGEVRWADLKECLPEPAVFRGLGGAVVCAD